MTDKQIKAADAIIKDGTTGGTTSPTRIFAQNVKDDWDINDITDAADFLEEHGMITIDRSSKDEYQYRLTDKGVRFKEDGKLIDGLLKEINEKEAKELAKEERDEKTKDAQLQKLEAELAVLKDMQERQKIFWESGIARDNRQKWQFWITWFLSGAAFLMAIINLIKDLYIK